MAELYLPPAGKDAEKDPFKEVDSKVKGALTREYNKVVHKSQAVSRELYQVGAKRFRFYPSFYISCSHQVL